MFSRLLPTQVSFFDYFEQHAVLCKDACSVFAAITQEGADVAASAARLKEIEHQADDLTHRCLEAINKTFITPIDRTDIHQLIKRMDDIVDSIDSAVSRIALYELTEMREESRQLAKVIVRASDQVETAVKGLRNTRNAGTTKACIIAIHDLENEGDDILRSALSRLFREEKDAILVIKWKEIFERLEKATDRCEQVANILEKIILEAS